MTSRPRRNDQPVSVASVPASSITLQFQRSSDRRHLAEPRTADDSRWASNTALIFERYSIAAKRRVRPGNARLHTNAEITYLVDRKTPTSENPAPIGLTVRDQVFQIRPTAGRCTSARFIPPPQAPWRTWPTPVSRTSGGISLATLRRSLPRAAAIYWA